MLQFLCESTSWNLKSYHSMKAHENFGACLFCIVLETSDRYKNLQFLKANGLTMISYNNFHSILKLFDT